MLLFKDGRNLIGFEVELYNIPGALHNVTSVLSKYNLNIVYLDISEMTDEIYMLFIVIEPSNSGIDVDTILSEVKKLSEYVKNISVADSLGNMVYSLRGHIRKIGGHRAILFGIANMEGFIEGSIDMFGMDLGRTLLFRIGLSIGEKVYENYGFRGGIRETRDFIKLLNALATGFYWGYIDEYTIEDDKIILYFKDLWECELWKGKVDKPASSLVKGILHGFFKNVLNREIEVEEEKCVAIGDPYCKFIINVKEGS